MAKPGKGNQLTSRMHRFSITRSMDSNLIETSAFVWIFDFILAVLNSLISLHFSLEITINIIKIAKLLRKFVPSLIVNYLM